MLLNTQAPNSGSDLQHTRHVYKALSLGRFALAFQPVVAAHAPATVLFHEGLLRYRGPSLDFNVFAVLERRGAIGHLDRCVVNSVINVLDPEVIVLGGGLSNIGALYNQVLVLLSRHVFSDQVNTRLVPARHGDSSGVRGAAWLWP